MSEYLIGKPVYYHGSLTKYHGRIMVVEKAITSQEDLTLRDNDTRYLLVYGPNRYDYLTNARRSSFTLVEETEENGHA